MDKNNYNSGNTRNGFEDTSKINIEKEVSELIKKGADRASMNELRKKFGDDKIFDMVQESYFDRLASIRKRSIKFTKLIERKYGMLGHPLHIILNKALKYKKKYNLSEEEFELFRQYYQKTMNMRNNASKYDVLVPNTNMAKVFGEDPYNNNKIHVSDGDHRIVKDILTVYELNRALWQQVTLQSITYDDSDPMRNTHLVDIKISNFSSFIHPVIAAMFLPKIARFDEYFLFTNLAYILRCKYLGEPVSTFHSYLMLYNLVTDPTDVVCNADSPLKDILNRVMLQVTLWKNVLRLRYGGVYDTYNSFAAADLMVHIDNCKLSTYDAPDLMMIGDENVIIRRLLSALAFRCATIFSTPTAYPLFAQNQMNMQVSTLNIPVNFTQVTKVPMIYIRLPILGMPALQPTMASTLDIQSALNTTQPMMYNGRLESRALSVAGTDGVLIVSIPRRTYKPMSGNIYNLPQIFNFANMPHHAFGLETLNSTKVLTNNALEIKSTSKEDAALLSNHLFIKSVVTLKERSDNNSSFIYGSKTFIVNMINQNSVNGNGSAMGIPVPGKATPVDGYNMVYVYDPITKLTSATAATVAAAAVQGAGVLAGQAAAAGAAAAAPIMSAVRNISEEDKVKDFTTNQTILIYTNELSKSPSSDQTLIKARYDQLIKLKKPDDPDYNPYIVGLPPVQQGAALAGTGIGLGGAPIGTSVPGADSVEKGIQKIPGDTSLLKNDDVVFL